MYERLKYLFLTLCVRVVPNLGESFIQRHGGHLSQNVTHGAAGFSKIIYMSDLVFKRPTLALVRF